MREAITASINHKRPRPNNRPFMLDLQQIYENKTLLVLEAAMLREWQRIPQQRILHLVQGMKNRILATIAVRRGYTKS